MQLILKENVQPIDIIIAQLKRHVLPLGVSKEQIARNKTVVKRIDRARAKRLPELKTLLHNGQLKASLSRHGCNHDVIPRIIIDAVFASDNRAIMANKIVS